MTYIWQFIYIFVFKQKKNEYFWCLGSNYKVKLQLELFLKKKENYRKLKERHENTCLKLRSLVKVSIFNYPYV